MLVVRIALGLLLAYAALVVLAWRLQERLVFPAPRAAVPDPRRVGIDHGEPIALALGDGTRLAGWYLAPRPGTAPPFPALLWFYGNGETIAALASVLRDFQPPGAALLVVDYPGYGGSGGRATEAGLYAAGDAAYDALLARPGVDPGRITVYGRSLGTAVATRTAARHPAGGLILESPFTDAAAMARHLYAVLPRFILTLSLDNLASIREARCPVLVFHGDRDRLVPTSMGMAVAAAAAERQGRPVEVVLIRGAGHNDTYACGGPAYRDKVRAFVTARRS